jgi:hypothetical protein
VDDGVRERLSAVIDLVSHETRAQTLVELAARQRESPHDEWLSFSELRRRVGHDDPGNFNYHLGRLRGSLVEQSESGYRLSAVGGEFVAVLLSSRFDPDSDVSVPDESVSCLLCSASAHPAAVDGRLLVECDEGHTFVATVGPDVFDGTPLIETLNVALFHALSDLRIATSGVCAMCDGPVERRSPSNGDASSERTELFLFVCRRCGVSIQTPARLCVADHPHVTGLLYDHGIDVREQLWTVVADNLGPSRRVETAPPRIAVSVAVEGEERTAFLDETATVRRVE